MSNSTFLSPSERAYIQTGLAHPTEPTRQDNRLLDAIRPIQISQGDAPQANGSARVVLGGKGGTEVVVGIKLDVVNAADVGEEADQEREGKESWRAKIEVDVTPQAFPHLNQNACSALSSYYANLLNDHFVPYLPPLPILPPYKYFQPNVHASIISSTSASVPFVLFTAVRAAFSSLYVPKTKFVGWESAIPDEKNRTAMDTEVDMTEAKSDRFGLEFGGGEGGITGAVRAAKAGGAKRKGKGKTTTNAKGKVVQVSGPGDEWDLEDYGGGDEGEGELLDVSVRVGLPVCVTLNLIPNSERFFLDATTPEELACPSRLHLFFCSSPITSSEEVVATSIDLRRFNVCGMRLEGGEGLELARLPVLLKIAEKIGKQMMIDLNSNMNDDV
ncbi:hypothetical protein NliqN6_3646 [Naganishia liquefaciens]|uniref:Ribosomal RNA-processing protein 42 n=1 Tax=Naganishia liquefaciens TaxID=104408 RepID=A0A8H3TW19_9TREE|nr:hypothetical protein NliqN6_3646 [Naganishia liquefaciens]